MSRDRQAASRAGADPPGGPLRQDGDAARRRLAWRLAVPPFVAGKLVTVVVMLGTVFSHSRTPGLPQQHEFLDAFSAWDGRNYLSIARDGYPSGPLDLTPGAPGHLWGFFPGYPILIRVADTVVRDTTVAAMIVAAVAELLALYYVALLVMDLRRGDSAVARTTVWLLALYPYGVFLTATYTEAPFVAAAAAALHHARRGDDGRAVAAATLAVALRLTGLCLVPALAWAHLARRRGRPGPGLAALALVVTPALLFLLWARRQTGDALAYVDIQRGPSFNRALTAPWTALRGTWAAATSGAEASTDYLFLLEVVFTVLGLLAVVAMVALSAGTWRRQPTAPAAVATAAPERSFPVEVVVYCAAVWLTVFTGPYLLSVPRYEIAMFPALLLVADCVAHAAERRAVTVAVSGGLMAYVTALYASGMFVA